jgi:hypothetical protein
MATPSAQQPFYIGTTREEHSRFSTNWQMRTGETTTSGSGGGTRHAPVNCDPTWSVEFPQDTVDYPEAIGLTKGTIIAKMFFSTGVPNVADKLEYTIVESVDKTVDAQNDVPRVVVRGKGGTVTENQTVA